MIREPRTINTLTKYCEKWAQSTQVSPEVHYQDMIFRWLTKDTGYEPGALEGYVQYYFEDGKRSAEKVRSLLFELGHLPGEGVELLEFASGYGCVTRHFANVLPEVQVTPCDIHQEAHDMYLSTFGMDCILSQTRPEDFDPGRQFDVIFCLSFYSHMPRSTFGQWLQKHYEYLKPGGSLLFTTLGTKDIKNSDFEMPEDGFAFWPSSEQADLDTADYGSTRVTKEFVTRELTEVVGVQPMLHDEGHWWGTQDLYVVRKN